MCSVLFCPVLGTSATSIDLQKDKAHFEVGLSPTDAIGVTSGLK